MFNGILLLTGILALNLAGYFRSLKEKGVQNPIENFGQINANHYREGQPNAEDIATLRKPGIRAVTNLRDNGPREEEVWVRAAEMYYFKIPLSTTHPASGEQRAEFLKLVSTRAFWPVFVHCAARKHRTGAMTAVYRITFDYWTADMVYREMKRFGFCSLPTRGSLKRFVYQYFQHTCGALKTANLSFPGFDGVGAYATAEAE